MSTRQRRRVTIADVARQAGVSTTAVSKVLRSAYGVSPATRDRVRAAIDELGYRPRAAARGMRGRTYTIGVLLPDLRNPFFPDILDGLYEQLAATDYQAIIVTGGPDAKAESRAIDALVDRQVDGLLMVAPRVARARLEEVAGQVPSVVLGLHEKSARYDTVLDDDEVGAELVVRHLIGLGHRRVAHIGRRAVGREIRAATYARVMREHGLEEEVAVAMTSCSEEGGHEGARELPARSPCPTAIFAGADQAAFGALRALHEAGLAVPADVSPAGYDNTRLAALSQISLTSVDQDGAVMGRTAGRLLLERVEGRTTAVRFLVTPALVPRRSTAPPPDDVN
ncbi:LacI family DNA-binding transcriptional regulator [Nonomuraea aridisoli]|uniref:LacI family transcriptional regulator n=1 Tax=Nonomuraea aridisoli TaxID=2070368 RepID=A0A2W2DK13_9ACTN|nr:LacI family DNA-binding transcriptional regulator [Nonomuraea aridisoli]PZG12286.1 LacI family transcriptional regulator [Nonomuraea aridisoli]